MLVDKRRRRRRKRRNYQLKRINLEKLGKEERECKINLVKEKELLLKEIDDFVNVFYSN